MIKTVQKASPYSRRSSQLVKCYDADHLISLRTGLHSLAQFISFDMESINATVYTYQNLAPLQITNSIYKGPLHELLNYQKIVPLIYA